jgi:hypothetical protein
MNLSVALRQLDRLTEALSFYRSNLPHISPLNGYLLSHQQPTTSTAMVTFVMVKWGTKYSAQYVNSLAHALRQFTSSITQPAVSIVCFTDNVDDPDLTREAEVQYRSVSSPLPRLNSPNRTLPKSLGWSGWWYKAYLFSEEANLSGTVIYLDLDTVLCSSALTRLFTELPPPLLLSTPFRPASESTPSSFPSSPLSPPCYPHSFAFACLGAYSLFSEGHHSPLLFCF